MPSSYCRGPRSSLFLGWQSNVQTDGQQKASTHEWGCSVSSQSHRNQTHVNETAPRLPNDQTHSPTQFLKASNCHTALDGECGQWCLRVLLHWKHPNIFYKAVHVSWTQSSRESAISYRADSLEGGAGREEGGGARPSWEREGMCPKDNSRKKDGKDEWHYRTDAAYLLEKPVDLHSATYQKGTELVIPVG